SAAVLGTHVNGYNPYLPGMTLFGLPQALFGRGVATDPRAWDGLAFVAAFAATLRIAGGAAGAGGAGGAAGAGGAGGAGGTGAAGSVRRTAVLTASPLIAFPLAVSGNALAVLGLTCLGLALTTRPDPRRPPSPAWAGLALGGAAALKATAWPAVLIVGVLFLARDGRGAAARFAAAAVAVLAVVVGPILGIQPQTSPRT